MAGLVDQILLNIQAVVTGQAGVQQLSGSIGGLTAQLVGLNAGMQVVGQVTAGVQQLVGSLGQYAQQADSAAVAARSWQIVLSRFNIDGQVAEQTMDRLNARTGASVESLKSAAAQYIKMGGTLEDFERGALAAASSWYDLSEKTISLDQSISNVTLGLAQGRSELMETSGIVVNASQAWKRYADANDTTVEAMDDATKAHAYALAVYKEEQLGIETLADKQTALSRAQNEANKANTQLGKTIGEVVLPGYTRTIQAQAEATQGLTLLIRTAHEGGDVLGVLAQRFPQMAGVITALRPVLAGARELFDDLGQTGRQIFDQTLLPAFRALAPQAQAMVAAIAPQFARFIAVAREIASTVREAFERVIVPLLRAVAPVVMQVVATVVPLLAQFAEAFSAYFQMVVAAWEHIAVPVIRTIAPVVQTAVRLVGDILGGAITLVKGVFNAVRALISGDWTGAWNIARDAVGTALLKIQDVLAELLPRVWKVITELAAGVGARAKTVGLNIRDGIIAGMAGLSAELATRIDEAVRTMTDRIPPWLRDRLGLTAAEAQRQAAIQTIQDQGTAAEGRITDRTQSGTQQAVRRAGEALPENSFSLAVWQQSFMARNDQKADFVVDYCLRWVRDTLGDASPKMRAQIDALLQANPEKFTDAQGRTGVVPTARSAYKNLQAAGLARDYSTTADLTPGDTVFYTENGQNHTGIYIGAGQVRGNNRVSFGESGGTNPVGTVGIDQLGSVSGYVRLQDLEAYLRKTTPATSQPKVTTTAPDVKLPAGGPAPTPTPAPATDGPLTAAQITKAQQLLAALDRAKKALEADPKNTGLTMALDAADQAVKRWTKDNDSNARALSAVQAGLGGVKKASDTYIASAADLKKYGTEALLLIKEQERAAQSGNAAEIERVRGKVTAFQEGGKAQAAVLAAEQAAYQVRQQQADQDAQKTKAREKEQRDLRAQVADERRTLTVSAAQQTLDRLQTLDAQELAAFKGTAAERLKIVQRQSQDEYAARMKVAQAQRDAALRESANTGGPNQAERDRQIRAQYEQTRLEQQGVRLETVRQATAAVTQAQEAYTAALDEGVRAGNEALAGLDRAALGGRELASTAQTLIPAQKTFDALQVRIDALRADLNTPGVAEAWIASIEDMGKAGRLTAPQVAALKDQIVGLRDETTTLIDLGGAVLDPDTGTLLFKTEQQVRGIGVAADGTTQNFFDLQNAIENVGRLSESELETLLQQSGLAADEAERLRAAWDALYGTLNTGPLLADNLQGRGVSDGAVPGAEDPATGFLAAGEKDALLARMETMHLDDIGKVYAGLILQGVQDTPLGQLIGGYLRDQAQAIQDALLADGGATQNLMASGERRGVRDESGRAVSTEPELTFLTDDQVRGIGQKTETISESYYDLENVIQNVMTMGREEMTALMVTAGLLPEQIAKVTAAWEDVHRAGETTAALDEQLAPVALRMQAIYDGLADGSVTAGDARVSLAAVRAELEGIGGPAAANLIQGVDATVAGFDELGGASAQVTAALLKLRGESDQPYDALIRTLEQLKTRPGAAVKEIDALIRTLEGLNRKSAALEKFNRYADYVAQVGTAFQQVGTAVGGDLGANITGIGVALQKGVDIAKDIVSGNYFGAAMKVIAALADAWGGYRRAQEEATKAQQDFQAGFKFIDASTFSSFTTRSRGFFADLFGGGPEVVKQINDTAATVARAIESGVTGGFTRGITNFLNGTGTLLDGIRDGIRGAIIDAITQAVIQGAIIKGTLGGLLTELTTTLAGGGDATGVITRIGAALPGVAQQLEATLTPLRRTIDAALPASSPSSGGSSPALASGGSTIQTGTPTVVIDVLREARDLLRNANDTGRLLVEAARKFDAGVDRFSAAVDRFSGPHASSTAGVR